MSEDHQRPMTDEEAEEIRDIGNQIRNVLHGIGGDICLSALSHMMANVIIECVPTGERNMCAIQIAATVIADVRERAGEDAIAAKQYLKALN